MNSLLNTSSTNKPLTNSRFRKFCQAVFLSTMLLAISTPALPAYAVTPPARTFTPPSVKVNLDLSSANKSVSASSLLGTTGQAQILQNHQTVTFTSSSMLTAAQFVALSQAMMGKQTLLLGSAGTATGGTFAINHVIRQMVSGLVVPTGVVAFDNVSRVNSLNLTGNLSNSGTIYAISNNKSVTTAVISANNIFNLSGGIFTSLLPATGLSGVRQERPGRLASVG